VNTAAYLDGDEATIVFAGLAPVLIGLYQVELTIPNNIEAGDPYLDIATPDAYTSQVQIPVGAKSAGLDGEAVKSAQIHRGVPEERRRVNKRGSPARLGARGGSSRRVMPQVQ
jgi:hypothetical protein